MLQKSEKQTKNENTKIEGSNRRKWLRVPDLFQCAIASVDRKLAVVYAVFVSRALRPQHNRTVASELNPRRVYLSAGRPRMVHTCLNYYCLKYTRARIEVGVACWCRTPFRTGYLAPRWLSIMRSYNDVPLNYDVADLYFARGTVERITGKTVERFRVEPASTLLTINDWFLWEQESLLLMVVVSMSDLRSRTAVVLFIIFIQTYGNCTRVIIAARIVYAKVYAS